MYNGQFKNMIKEKRPAWIWSVLSNLELRYKSIEEVAKSKKIQLTTLRRYLSGLTQIKDLQLWKDCDREEIRLWNLCRSCLLNEAEYIKRCNQLSSPDPTRDCRSEEELERDVLGGDVCLQYLPE